MAPRLVSCISQRIASIAIYNANSTQTNTIVKIGTIDLRLIHAQDFSISHGGRPSNHYNIMGILRHLWESPAQLNCKHNNG